MLQAVFKTTPRVTKPELRELFEKVYETPVLSIHTAIVAGKLKQRMSDQQRMRKPVAKKMSDYKKVWVQFGRGSVRPKARTTSHAQAMNVLRQDFAAAQAAAQEARHWVVGEAAGTQQSQSRQPHA